MLKKHTLATVTTNIAITKNVLEGKSASDILKKK